MPTFDSEAKKIFGILDRIKPVSHEDVAKQIVHEHLDQMMSPEGYEETYRELTSAIASALKEERNATLELAKLAIDALPLNHRQLEG